MQPVCAQPQGSGLLDGLEVVEVGESLAVAVCGRLFADQGARVWTRARPRHGRLGAALAAGKQCVADAGELDAVLRRARVLIGSGTPAAARALSQHPEQLRERNAGAVIVHLSPFGLSGPRAEEPATDLTLFAASGIAQLLIGEVDDPRVEPPQRPVGEQSAFICGIAGACAGVNALHRPSPALIDVAAYEALASLAVTELTRAANGRPPRVRKRMRDGNGATVCILPCSDGYVAISPREEHQWRAWLGVMGNPAWGHDPRFASKAERVANWDALYALMCAWSESRGRAWIADRAQAARVPSFILASLAEHLHSAQLAGRRFFHEHSVDGRRVRIPGSPFHVETCPAAPAPAQSPPAPSATMPSTTSLSSASVGAQQAPRSTCAEPSDTAPLAGVRVLDFSWVIAGPTATRYLAALGADVIKVEAPGRADPGRASELHSVLGQGKRGLVLDLKNAAGSSLAAGLAGRCDVLIENFATGVMERFGLGAETLLARQDRLCYLSASGLGRTGPQAQAVAYGTLLQCYSGFATLNGEPGKPPRVGMAWLDPMCGLMLAFSCGVALYSRRRTGRGVRVDFSMVEAMLWTMLEPLLECQDAGEPRPLGNASRTLAPHGIYATRGSDEWIAIAVDTESAWQALVRRIPSLAACAALSASERLARATTLDRHLAQWCATHDAERLAGTLRSAGIAAARVCAANDLVRCPQLLARRFWEQLESGTAPGLPWRADLPRRLGAAPGLGQHTGEVLREVLGIDADAIEALRKAGAFG